MKEINDSRQDFTRSNYRRLLEKAASKYKIGTLSQYKSLKVTAIWRHDVDYSPQSALAMGKIENEVGIKSTFYFNLRSEFYNLFEDAVTQIVKDLQAMGHEIGLHFDATLSDISSVQNLIKSLEKEKSVFETLLDCQLKSFSFHNPSSNTESFKSESYAGLINAYATDVMSRFKYCSDSNGYWRFTPLEDFINQDYGAICVLTHPAWWTETVMSPRDRIVRCIRGRADSTLLRYDELLAKHGRKNIF